MPYLVVCPNCGSKLKAAQPVPAGRNLTCPQCKAAFTLSEPAPEVDAASLPTAAPKPATAEAPAAPRPAPAPAPPAKPRSMKGALDAFSASKGRSADGDVREAEVVDDEDDRPRPRRRDEDDDDRPRSRRREENDEEDDRPRARRGRNEDDEDEDRPRARRGRDEDDEEDERPKSRRRGHDEDNEDDDERPSARRRRGDDDDDERPKGRRGRDEDDEEEDERPKARRGRDEDEDEEDESGRPKARGRRDENEEDERPKGRRGRDADDEEDERPKGRRGRDEDDEEDERPSRRKARAAADDDEDEEDDRPRRGRGKKKKNKGMLIGLLAGAAMLFLLGGAAIMYFADPFGLFGGGGASSEMLAWMPAETQSIEGVDYNEVNKYPKALSSARQDLKDAETIGLKAEDIANSMQAKKPGKGAAEVTVLKMKSAPDKDKIIKTAGNQEATANGKKYYKTNWGGGLYFASDKLVVLTRSEATMTALLQKEDGKIAISKDLQDCVKRADGHMWMAAVGSDANIFGGAAAGGGAAKGGGPGFPGLAGPPAPKSALMTAKVSGDEVTIKMEFTYADSETAKKAGEAIEGMFKMFKELMGAFGKGGKGGLPDPKMQDAQKMFDSMKVSTSGNTVTITMKGPIDAMDGFGKGGGFGGM